MWADHPSDWTKSWVCIYYKQHIHIIKRDDICTSDNSLVTEICSQGEKYFLTSIYRSLRQSHDDFYDFCTKLIYFWARKIMNYIQLYLIVTGYFNACCSRWWQNGIANSTGQEIYSHYQLDINKWLINLTMLYITLHHALSFYLTITRIWLHIMELMSQSLINATIILP